MASYNQWDAEELVEQSWSGKRIIFLESEDDVRVMQERWFFDRGEGVDFHPASGEGAGGCHDVIARVEEARARGLNDVWGIVDRDALASSNYWEAFFDCDDRSFTERKVFGEFILVLRCWEMENYLLHPEIIEQHLADIHGRSPRSPGEVVEELFEILCCKLPIVAANLLLNSQGQKGLKSDFGLGVPCMELLETVQQQLSKIGLDDALENWLVRMNAFGSNEMPRSLEQWLAMLRIVDGKLLLKWLRHHFRIQDECKYLWARSLGESGKVKTMLDEPVWKLAYGEPM